MPLFCECEYDHEPGTVIWDFTTEFSTLKTSKRKRCCSCHELISIGAVVASFERFKLPDCDIEYELYGEDCDDGPLRATKYHCEDCAGLFFSLEDLGFCGQPWEDQRELVQEYAEIYGTNRKR